jgi:ABC-2 type transport system permease protein
LVAAREIRERGRSLAFLASVAIMLVAVTSAVVLPGLLDAGPGPRDVGLAGVTPADLPTALRASGAAAETTVRVHRYGRVADGEDAVRDGEVDLLVVDGRRLEWRTRDEQLEAMTTGTIQLVRVRERAAARGIAPGEIAAVMAPVPIESVELGRVRGRSSDDETAAFVMTLLLFGTITTYGAMVLTGVVEEKSSRTVEVLLARMPPRCLLAGKIAGIGLLGLAQVAATAGVALLAAATVDSIDVPAVRGSVIGWAVVWFLVGYALYATVFGTLGSLASRAEDASSVTGPVTVVLVLAFMLSFASIGSAGTAWARLVSWFPLTAPLAMPNRLAMGTAAWWEPIGALALAAATIAGLVVIGGRVYTRAILHTGPTLSLGAAWRGDVAGAPAVSRAAAGRPGARPAAGRPGLRRSRPRAASGRRP